MIFLIYILLVLILGFFVVVLPLFLVFALDSLIRGHDLPTSRRATRALAAILQKYKPDAKIFYDLGCARGALSLRLKKILPRVDIYGIDNSAARIFFANLKNKILRRKVNFQKQACLPFLSENRSQSEVPPPCLRLPLIYFPFPIEDFLFFGLLDQKITRQRFSGGSTFESARPLGEVSPLRGRETK